MQEKQFNPSTAYRRSLAATQALLPPSSHFHLFPSASSENLDAYQPQPAVPHGYSLYHPNSIRYLSQISPYQGQGSLFPAAFLESENITLMKPPPSTHQILNKQREPFQKDQASQILKKIQQQAESQDLDQEYLRFPQNLPYQQIHDIAMKGSKEEEDSRKFHTNLSHRQAPDLSISELNKPKLKDQMDAEDDRTNLVRIQPQNTYDMSSSRKFSLDSQYRKDSERSFGESKRKSSHRNKIKYKSNDSDRTAGRWKAEEHQKFVQGLRKYGRDWKKVEHYIGSRSGAQIRSHAQKFFNKIAKQFNVTDAAQFVISGEFQKRLNSGALSQSMQQSTFLVNNNMYSEDLDASIHSHVSASKNHLPSSFKKSHNNSQIQSQNNTPTKQSRKKKLIDEDREQKIQSKDNIEQKFLDQFSEQVYKSDDKGILSRNLIYESILLDQIRVRYEILSKRMALVASRIQDVQDDFIKQLIHDCKNVLQQNVISFLGSHSDNRGMIKYAYLTLELQIMSEKLKAFLGELQEIMQIRQNKQQNKSKALTVKPLRQKIPEAKSYFRNIILPSLGCRDTFQMMQKYPRVADWSLISFSSHPSSSSNSIINQISINHTSNSNNISSSTLELH